MTTDYYFWGLQRVGLLRGGEKMVYWCMPLFLPCFLSSFYQFLSLFLSILFTLSCLLLSCRGLFFSLESFPFFWVPFSGYLLFSYYGLPSLGAFPLRSPSFSVFLSSPIFFLFPYFFLFHSISFFCRGYLPFIVNWFNGISPFYP